MRLASIRHAGLKQIARQPTAMWGAARTLPLDNVNRCRAQSWLAGIGYRDGSTNPGTLTLDQAHDVLAWATSRIR